LPGNQDIEVAIAIHVHGANVIGRLVEGDFVNRKLAPAIVFRPDQLAITDIVLGARSCR
jgi:hypothetical protein